MIFSESVAQLRQQWIVGCQGQVLYFDLVRVAFATGGTHTDEIYAGVFALHRML